jgi:putative redox protein
MKSRIEFDSQGNTLSGLLESPVGEVRAYVLFAHCFTCGKDIAAASRISRALTQHGYAVLRFDFTGLGNSDGDFSNTNFSSNLEDLIAAADYLRDNYQAPQLLVGHSLGGAAVLSVAEDIPEIKGVVSIAAPAYAEHVVHNFNAHLDEINSNGVATVQLGSRKFSIKKQFIDDVAEHSKAGFNLGGKALLVMHSPVDATVGISEAEKIYSNAKHPKSFVSLDKADHLLTNKADAEYVAMVVSGWADKYIDKPEYNKPKHAENGSVVISEKNHKFTLNVASDSHYWLADEPLKVGGDNLGPDPYEHLLAALGTCTVMTIRMYATHKKILLDDIEVTLNHERNYFEDCKNTDKDKSFTERIHRQIKLSGDISAEQRQRLLEIADKCPVHKTLHGHLVVTTELDK